MNKMYYSNYFIRSLTALLLFGLLMPLTAQTDKDLLVELVAEEQEAVNALVLYPEDNP